MLYAHPQCCWLHKSNHVGRTKLLYQNKQEALGNRKPPPRQLMLQKSYNCRYYHAVVKVRQKIPESNGLLPVKHPARRQLLESSAKFTKFTQLSLSLTTVKIPLKIRGSAPWSKSPPKSSNILLLLIHPITLKFIKISQLRFQLSCWQTDRQTD